jgi:hypothetical protein
VLALVNGLPVLVEVLDSRNVLDGVLQVARAAPRMAYINVSLISSSVAPACFAAAKRPGTQDVQDIP